MYEFHCLDQWIRFESCYRLLSSLKIPLKVQNYTMTILIIALNALFSFIAFSDRIFFDRFSFWVDPILRRKEYFRLITSGFLHVDISHLLFNMFSLYVFGDDLEKAMPISMWLALAFVSLLGGNLISLWTQRENANYRAVGASGMVSGLIFSAIVLFPEIRIGLIFIPIFAPGWLFGLLFVLISIFGMHAQRDNIGHEAHLGGALSGLLFTIIVYPSAAMANYSAVGLLLFPSLILFYLSVFRPELFDRIKRRFNQK